MNLVDQFFDRINQLPTLPKVVQEVNLLLQSDEVDIRTLAHVLDHDQALSARVLRMSNSAYFGCSRTVKTIEDAVTLIGLRNLGTIVTAAGVKQTFQAIPGLDLNRFWWHGLTTAGVARELAPLLRQDPEIVYLAALMHNIGQFPIHIIFPEAAIKIADDVMHLGITERCTIEHNMLGVDHCEIGEMLAKHWNFPEIILRAIRYYANPGHPQACKIAGLVNIAATVAEGSINESSPQHIVFGFNPDALAAFAMSTDDWVDKVTEIQYLSEEAKAFL